MSELVNPVGGDGDSEAALGADQALDQLHRLGEGGVDPAPRRPAHGRTRPRLTSAAPRTRHPRAGPPGRRRGTAARSRSATIRSSSSPTWWPSASLTSLNRSRSSSSTAQPSGIRPGEDRAQLLLSRARLGSPVSVSCRASCRSCSTTRVPCIATARWPASVRASLTSSVVSDVVSPSRPEATRASSSPAPAQGRQARPAHAPRGQPGPQARRPGWSGRRGSARWWRRRAAAASRSRSARTGSPRGFLTRRPTSGSVGSDGSLPVATTSSTSLQRNRTWTRPSIRSARPSRLWTPAPCSTKSWIRASA